RVEQAPTAGNPLGELDIQTIPVWLSAFRCPFCSDSCSGFIRGAPSLFAWSFHWRQAAGNSDRQGAVLHSSGNAPVHAVPVDATADLWAGSVSLWM
ncbi:MAG: hypothetical protein KDI67_12750, partial [Gammaproteobacteria bacterium]|nr:hypothetical protein [Gammaproteobacteria bacterium]